MINQYQKLSAQLVVVSDVHMQAPDDRRGELLIDLVSRIEAGVTEVFLLNGDIFDFCFGQSAYYRAKFRPLGAALEALAAAGTRVVFVEGNHEFWMDAIGWRGVEVVKEKNLALKMKTGETIRVMHGDLLKDDPWYRAFRGLVKSRFLAFFAGLLPGRFLDLLTLRYAKASRAQDEYRTLNHASILSNFSKWLDEGDYAHGIIGHFHVPYAQPRKSGRGMMMSVDSWDKPNAMVYDQGCFKRVFLETPGASFQVFDPEKAV